MKEETFAQRLLMALEKNHMKAADLSKLTGVSEGTISCYINGRYEAKQNRVRVFATTLGVDPAWLMGYDVPLKATDDASPAPIPPGFEPLPKMVKRPLIGDIACGEPITAEQNVQDMVDVPENISCDFCLRCHGDSMIDTGIHDNDVVYIKIQPTVDDGEIAAVRIGDEATLKRVYYDGGTITLVPANSAYRPHSYSGPELADIQIEGKAVGYTHWF